MPFKFYLILSFLLLHQIKGNELNSSLEKQNLSPTK